MLVALAGVVGFAGLVGCADDSSGALDGAGSSGAGGADRQDYVDAQVTALQDGRIGDVGDAGARCLAEAVVDLVTVEALQAADVTPDDLAGMGSLVDLGVDLPDSPGAVADTLATRLGDCDATAELEDALVASLGSARGAELSGPDVGCVAENLPDGLFEDALAETVVQGTDRLVAEVVDTLDRCPDALAELVAGMLADGATGELPASAPGCLADELDGRTGAAAALFAGDDGTDALLAELAGACAPGLGFEAGGAGDEGDDGGPAGGDDGDGSRVGDGFGEGSDGSGASDGSGRPGGSGGGPAGDRAVPVPAPPPPGTPPDAVEVTVLVEGTGPAATAGDTLLVLVAGTTEDGTALEPLWDVGDPFPVTLGEGMLIEGWEEGMLGARAGERRRLVVGSDKAYGPAGVPGEIAPDSALAFEIEVVEIAPG